MAAGYSTDDVLERFNERRLFPLGHAGGPESLCEDIDWAVANIRRYLDHCAESEFARGRVIDNVALLAEAARQ